MLFSVEQFQLVTFITTTAQDFELVDHSVVTVVVNVDKRHK